MFSPRARGCSQHIVDDVDRALVFPACAGMFLRATALGSYRARFPRVRGDVPGTAIVGAFKQGFSPRARGCSASSICKNFRWSVFPACAGMFLRPPTATPKALSFPRVRGDVPRQSRESANRTGFSPRARGCSPHAQITKHAGHVFPACAGMFLCDRGL